MSMLAVRVAKRQWATTAEPGIFSQIVICLFASGYLRYIVLQYVGPDTWRIERINKDMQLILYSPEYLGQHTILVHAAYTWDTWVALFLLLPHHPLRLF